MKVLITGGAGFIGSAVIRYLLGNTDVCVMNVDKLTYAGNLENLEAVSDSSRYQFEKIDIIDKVALQKAFLVYQPDAVMHLAAESHVDRSISGPAAFIETNIVGTYTLLEVVRHYYETLSEDRRRKFRFLHVSTDEVYGDLESEGFFTEKTAYAPSSPYSASKASSDHLVRAWHRTYGIPIIVTNCSNNYGPHQFPEKLIPLVIHSALSGQPIPVYGSGEQIRDWLYVEDHAAALFRVLCEGGVGETYNIGGHNTLRNIDVVRQICSLLEEYMPSNPFAKNYLNPAGFSSLITYVADRPGHDVRYAVDASKLSICLDWKPAENFESGIRKTIQWYLDNQQWVANVLNGSYQKKVISRVSNI